MTLSLDRGIKIRIDLVLVVGQGQFDYWLLTYISSTALNKADYLADRRKSV